MKAGRAPGSRREESRRRYAKHREAVLASNAAWRASNPDKNSGLKKAWAQRNRARKRATDRAWQLANPEKMREYRHRYAQENPDKWAGYGAKRRAQKLRATPSWLTAEQRQEIQDWYALAAATGREVDHIVPLAGRNVRGLHVPWNLQLLTVPENRAKGNRHA